MPEPTSLRACRCCGADISHRHPNATSCSRRCQLATVVRHPGVPLPPRRCRSCGSLFFPKRSDKVACNPRCTARWHYEARPDEYRAAAASWAASNPDRRRVIGMTYKARRRGWEGASPGVSARDWARLVARFGGRCAYCAAPGPLHMDHVVPLARGGQHAIGNVLPACADCNTSKGASLLVEWRRRAARRSAA